MRGYDAFTVLWLTPGANTLLRWEARAWFSAVGLERLPGDSSMCSPACERLARPHQVSPIKSSPSGPRPGRPDITDYSPRCCCHTCSPLAPNSKLPPPDYTVQGSPGVLGAPRLPGMAPTPSPPPLAFPRFSLSPRTPPAPGRLQGAQEACFPL